MNILPAEKQVAVIAALTEGCSIRAVERLTGIHRDTIMRLGVRVGQGCAGLHDRTMRDLQVPRIEMDELWSFVAKKQRRITKDDPSTIGDQYTFLGLAGSAKAIISYLTGKRTSENTQAFVLDLRERVIGAPEISSDAWPAYTVAVERAFGTDCTFGTIDKHLSVEGGSSRESARRYSPAAVVAVTKRDVVGRPAHISTSYIERQNLTLRMQQRRFTRLTNGFSKKLENHRAAVSLYVAFYNLCRVHEALRITPAMQLGVTDHVWTISELVEAAKIQEPIEPKGKSIGLFRVIDGGLS